MSDWILYYEIEKALAVYEATGFDPLIHKDGNGAKYSLEDENRVSSVNTALLLRIIHKFPAYLKDPKKIDASKWTAEILQPKLIEHIKYLDPLNPQGTVIRAYNVSQLLRAIPKATFDGAIILEARKKLTEWLKAYINAWLFGRSRQMFVFILFLSQEALGSIDEDLLINIKRVSEFTISQQAGLSSFLAESQLDLVDLALTLSLAPAANLTPGLWHKGIEILNKGLTNRAVWKNQQSVIRLDGNYSAGCSAFEACIAVMKSSHITQPFDILGNALVSHWNWLQDTHRSEGPWHPSDIFQNDNVADTWFNCLVIEFLITLREKIQLSAQSQLQEKYRGRKPNSQVSWKSIILEKDVHEKIEERFIDPIKRNPAAAKLEQCTAILFGPPGTAKTTLVETVAEEVGWPLIELGVADFLSGGLNNVFARSIEIFSDLERLQNVVVLLDEVEGVFAERGSMERELTQKFLTSALLPPLKRLRDRAKILLFVATNHIREFDEAVKRPGRIDLIIPVGPPDRYQCELLLEGAVKIQKDIAKELAKLTPEGITIAELLTFKGIAIPTGHDPGYLAHKMYEEWKDRFVGSPLITSKDLADFESDKKNYRRIY